MRSVKRKKTPSVFQTHLNLEPLLSYYLFVLFHGMHFGLLLVWWFLFWSVSPLTQEKVERLGWYLKEGGLQNSLTVP